MFHVGSTLRWPRTSRKLSVTLVQRSEASSSDAIQSANVRAFAYEKNSIAIMRQHTTSPAQDITAMVVLVVAFFRLFIWLASNGKLLSGVGDPGGVGNRAQQEPPETRRPWRGGLRGVCYALRRRHQPMPAKVRTRKNTS